MSAAVLVGIAGLAVLGLLLAPIEALGWWAGWFEGGRDRSHPNLGFHVQPQPSAAPPDLFVVFLDGIARAGTEENIRQVERFVRGLRRSLRGAAVIDDLFPYSVTGTPLTEQRLLSKLWRFADGRKRTARLSAIGFMINLRNLFQVMASADRRYAPVYFQAEAQLLINTLLKHGFDPARPSRVALIGYSGGAHLALGAAAYVQRVLRTPVQVISIGGVMSGHPLMNDLERIDHLRGTLDPVERLGALMFPRRWRVFPLSPWNRARREGRLRVHAIGPMGHIGPGSYVDPNAHHAGRSHARLTLGAVVHVLCDDRSGDAGVGPPGTPRPRR